MSKLIVVLLAAVSFAACSGASPATPAAASATHAATDARVAAVPGSYALTFNTYRNGVYQEVSSLPVSSDELILKAYVTDSAGAPAAAGSITFEYCSYPGPRNDIDRADEAPKEACADGTAAWVRLRSLSVTAGSCPALASGYACMNFGVVQIPRTVGFRIRYDPKKGSIAGATTEPENFTWVAGS